MGLEINVLLRLVGLCLTALFVLAATHKIRVVAAGRAEFEPLIWLTPWRRSHAAGLLVGLAAVEMLIAIGVLASPAVGFVLAAALVAAYTHALGRLPAGRSCNCFGGLFSNRTARGERRRNLFLTLLALTAAAAHGLGVDTAPVGADSLGLFLVVTGVVAGVEAVRRLPKPEHVAVLHAFAGRVPVASKRHSSWRRVLPWS